MGRKILLSVLLLISEVCASIGGKSGFLRFDVSNFQLINSGSFLVLPCAAISPDYQVAIPPGGEASGGSFLFDTTPYSCMKSISMHVEGHLDLKFSFWCGNHSELKVITQCNYYSERTLCHETEYPERNGRWNIMDWDQKCTPMNNVSRSIAVSQLNKYEFIYMLAFAVISIFIQL